MTKTTPLLLFIFILSGYLAIWIYYTYNYRNTSLVKSLSASILSLNPKEDYYKEISKIETVKQSIVKNRIAKKQLGNVTEDFFNTWQKKGVLDIKTAADFANKIKTALAPISGNASIENNQMLGSVIIVLLFALFLSCAFFTELLRDVVGNKSILGKTKPPFSLSRTQLAVWITTIASFYVYSVFWDQRDVGELNGTALTLMGISAGTFAMGAILDTSEIQQGITRNQDQPTSNNIFTDILSDKNGISVQRFQNVIWTVVAIIVYFYKFNNPDDSTSVLPELSSTLLALTGISSATYLTLKTRENIPSSTENVKGVKIQVVPNDKLAKPILTAAQSSTVAPATVTLTSNAGTIATTPLTETSKDQFTSVDLVPGTYRIDAIWDLTAGGSTATLTGVLSVALDHTTIFPLKIDMIVKS